MSKIRSICAALGGAAILASASAQAATLFSDDFNRADLNTPNTIWVGKSGTTVDTSAQIIDDPLNPGNGVMNFKAVTLGGDAFTAATGAAFAVTAGTTYTLNFAYLGHPGSTTTPGNGGFIGLTDAISGGNQYWVGGTETSFLGGGLDVTVTPVTLDDDNAWHSISIDFTPQSSKTYYIMVEDFSGVPPLGSPGDAYFDNISVIDPASPSATVVPTPAAAAAGSLLLGVLVAKRRPRA